MTFVPTLTDKLECAERELAMRRNVYPRLIEQNRMSYGKAELEIAVMASIVDDYRAMYLATKATTPEVRTEHAPEFEDF